MNSLEDGVYTADSDSDGYGSLLAAMALGEATMLGERYLPSGVRSIAVRVGGTGENPEIKSADGGFSGAVGIGEDYYSSALREYSPWDRMWVRESLQNAIDAGAKHVDLTIIEDNDGTATVACDDDGPGMDRDVIVNKFLMLGGTGKKGMAGATGGFGKAKELLILPWLSWSIASRDVVVEGANTAYEGRYVAARVGTRLEVHMPAERKASVASALYVLKRSYVPGVTFRVNGEIVRADLEVGEDDIIESFSSDSRVRLYHKKARRSGGEYKEGQHGFYIRKNGLYMFEFYLPSGVPGFIVCEVLAPSIEVFNTSRMGFNDWTLRNEIEKFVASLSKDVYSAIRKKKKQFHKVWEGVRTRARPEGELQAIMLQHIGASSAIEERDKVKELAEVYRKNVEEEVRAEEAADAAAETAPVAEPPVGRAPPELVEGLLGAAIFRGGVGRQVEVAVKQITYLPPFYIHGEDWVPQRRLTPDGNPMMPTLRKLARFWTEICRLILIRLGCDEEYGVGWIFEEDQSGDGYTKGETVRGPEGMRYLLLNPYRGGFIHKGEFYSLRNDDDLDIIWSTAVHECVHLASGIGGHEESFSSALSDAIAKTSRAHRSLTHIRDHITRRTEADKARIAERRAKR